MTKQTLRSIAQQAVIEAVTDRAAYEHMPNYYKLHVYRDGAVGWTEHIDRLSDIIDSHAEHFAAVPSVCCVGTGSYACNCEYCNARISALHSDDEPIPQGCYETRDEAIQAAVADSDLSGLEADMLAQLDAIPLGYFNDEESVYILHELIDHYGENTPLDYVSDLWGSQPCQMTPGEVLTMHTELDWDDYNYTLRRTAQPGEPILLDRTGNPILVMPQEVE